MLCTVWYNLYNLRNVKNTYGGVLLLVKLQVEVGCGENGNIGRNGLKGYSFMTSTKKNKIRTPPLPYSHQTLRKPTFMIGYCTSSVSMKFYDGNGVPVAKEMLQNFTYA